MAQTSFLRKLGRSVALFLIGLLLIIVAVIAIFRFVNPPTSAFMQIDQWQHPDRQIRQRWVGIDHMSPWLPLAVIASEDQRFPEHWGFDVDAIASAIEEYQHGEGLRGASTISQQTAKNLFLWGGRNFVRKGLEVGLTVALEALWSKRRIMEVYLNIAEFGDGVYGVEMASRHYFGISARHLSISQAARLAAVLPDPKGRDANASTAFMTDRVDWISRQMGQLGGMVFVKRMIGK